MQRKDRIKFVSDIIKKSRFETKKELYEHISTRYFAVTNMHWSTNAVRHFIRANKDSLVFTEKPNNEIVLQSKLQIENAKLKEQIKDQRSLLKTLTEDAIGMDDFMSAIEDSIPRLPILQTISRPQLEDDSDSEKEIVLLLSDHHITRTVDIYEMEGYNEYNFEIWACRYYHIIKETIETTKSLNTDVRTINVLMLGDMFNDTHRLENIATNEFEPVQGTVKGSYVLAQGIAMLFDHFETVKMVGNCW